MSKKLLIYTIGITVILFMGCSTGADDMSIDFGYEYEVIVSEDRPSLTDGELVVEVGYDGCDPAHEFELNLRAVGSDAMEMWLVKLTEDEECEDRFEQLNIYDIEEEIEGASERVLLTPDGGEIDL